MTEQELEKCRKLYNEKMEKAKKIKSLAEDEKVKEILNLLVEDKILTKEVIKDECSICPTKIVDSIIDEIALKGTEELYYVRADFTTKTHHKKYTNLENPKIVIYKQGEGIEEFENKNLVLTRCNKDNSKEVLNRFIRLSLNSGVEQAKTKILSIYL